MILLVSEDIGESFGFRLVSLCSLAECSELLLRTFLFGLGALV